MSQTILKSLAVTSLMALAATAPALTVQVDPVGGTDNGSSPFLTLEAALTAVAGADAGADVVNLRTNGVHQISNVDFTVTGATADGNLTIQTDAGDSGQAVIVLGNPAGRHMNVQVDPNVTVDIINVVIISTSASVGGVGGDGIQVQNPSTGLGVGTVNFTDVVIAANDGLNAPVPYDQPKTDFANASWPTDDWVDYFPDTTGTLASVTISHCGDEGLIVRGQTDDSRTGASVTINGNSAISYCAGRAIQPAFGGSGGVGIPTINCIGTEDTRIRLFGNVTDNPEPTVTLFNGAHVFEYVDVVNNNDVGFRVDTDTCDSLSMDHVRVGGNAGQGIVFLFGTADLPTATITNCTFHDQGAGFANLEVDAAVTGFTLGVTDTIFTGASVGEATDQILITSGSTATVNLANCGVVTTNPWSVGIPAFPDLAATSEVGSVNISPRYASAFFDGTDPQNPNYLRVRYTSSDPAYLTASSTAGELRGGNGLPLIEIVITDVDDWSIYR